MLGDTVLIVNPQAGRGMNNRQLAGFAKEAAKILAIPSDCVVTVEPGGQKSASAIAACVQKQGARNIIAAGGDGTVSRVINGLVLPDDTVTIGIAPIGTSNAFASHCGIPYRLKDALEVIREGETKKVDVCKLEGAALPRYALFTLSVGLDALINERAHHLKPKFRRWRLPTIAAYLLPILGCSFSSVPVVEISVKVDGRTIVDEKKAAFAAIVNTPRYGGGMICPWARIDDGVLNFTLCLPMKRHEVISRAFQMWRGTLIRHPAAFLVGIPFKSLEITGAYPMPAQVDGEPMPLQTHIKVSVLEHAISVLVPKPKPGAPVGE